MSARKIWLIGASSGIGFALAEQYLQAKCHLVVSARSEDKLQQLAAKYPNQVDVLPLDITDVQQCEKVAEYLADGTQLDKVIVNAGTCEYMNGNELELQSLEQVMQTNFVAPARLVKLALPLLNYQAPKRPQLVLICSSVTYLALPRAAAYGGSKAALRYFAESVYLDLVHLGVDVRLVSPGFVKTPLTDNNDFPMPFLLSAEQAAKRIVRGLRGSRFDIAFPRRLTWMLKLIHWLPDRWRLGLLCRLSRVADSQPPQAQQE